MALYAFDGTWNSATLHDTVEQADETNVANFCEAYDPPDKVCYAAGPGTRFGKFGRIIGGGTGIGGRTRITEAYEVLCENWAAGDEIIDIIGFSRGAALALDFANRIAEDGVRRAESKDVVADNPVIRFLGLWDVVSSFGIPIDIGPIPFQKINIGHDSELPAKVEYCFHAMAMDERRETFAITRIMNAYEVWFRGVHSDIGGGNGNVGLSYITLRWMLHKAKAAGLPIKEAVITSRDAKINPDAEVRPAFDPIKDKYRVFLESDRFHYTVKPRPDYNNPPERCAIETAQDEKKAIRLQDPTAGDAKLGPLGGVNQ